MDQFIERLEQINRWQHEYLGRQHMQTAVLKWAVENREAIQIAGLAGSLVACMDAEIALHRAAKPSKELQS